jgi:uncharacterized protein with PIN domain
MGTARFRFYAELNDFLPAARRFQEFTNHVETNQTIKDAIEALGVPHTEVDLILVNGDSVGFDYRLQNEDHVAVYPMFESMDIAADVRVRPEPLRKTRFIVDANLGKLARHLRLIGFDTLYSRDADDADLAATSQTGKRVLLTRDVGVLKRSEVTHGYYVRSDDPEQQVVEVLKRFDLSGALRPFSRCLECNGLLEPVPKEEVEDRLEPGTRDFFDEFWLCSDCGRVYWQGAHHKRMSERIERIRRAVTQET